MAFPARINRNTSRALAVIAVRVLDDAHMTGSPQRSSPNTRCARGSTRARRKVRARTWHTAQRSTTKRRRRATCSGCLS